MFQQNGLSKKVWAGKVGIVLLFTLIGTNAVASTDIVYLEQGWNDKQRTAFYETPQGSYLIPLSWYFALEQPENKKLFSNPKHIKKYKYTFADYEYGMGKKIPLGFAVETVNGGQDWLGYTCAACHTNDILYKGSRLRIDGAPTLADFNGFIARLQQSVDATLQDDKKFDRFASRVLVSEDAVLFEALRTELTSYYGTLAAFTARNDTKINYGYARLDAFGIIMNEVFANDLHYPGNINEPNAPVSYPFLWNTSQHDWVQWNGSANNPLGRNVGEVLGTFGYVNLVDLQKLGESSARGKELIDLENLVKILTPPKWPEKILGELDQDKVAQGRIIYEQFRDNELSCAYCHPLRDSAGNYPVTPAEENMFGVQFVETKMTPLKEIGTDPLMATNFATRIVSTAHLAPYLPPPYAGASELPAPALLSILVGLATQNAIGDIQPPLSAAEVADAIGYRIKANGLPPYSPKNLLAYRARPLDGIWASAPYLHNGSVQNLYELLLPAEKRKTKFYVGSRKFNPKYVGFANKRNPSTSLLDVSLPGNSNLGHEYGTGLSDSDKWALIEFLKSL